MHHAHTPVSVPPPGPERPAALTALAAIPLAQLLHTCGEQIDRFRRGAEDDPRFCLELFRRAIDARDHEAWRGLIELYRPLLIARLKRDGIDPDMAEEAVQEACVALWLKSVAGVFSTRERTLAEVLSYLWGSVRFARIKLKRQQRDTPLLVDNEAQVPLPPIESSATIERTIDARALLMRVRGQVTQQEWHIFWLRFARELPPREIATRLSVPVEEIHLTLASAKRRLRGDDQLRHFADMSAAEKPFVVASIKRHTQINQKGAVS